MIQVRNTALVKGHPAVECCSPPGRKKKLEKCQTCASDMLEYGYHQVLCGKIISSYKAFVQLQGRYTCGLILKR